jgi:hypothetical protein
MAHKSKKKHLKHVHAHERAAAPSAATRAKKAAAKNPATEAKPRKRRGIVRSIAHAASEKAHSATEKLVEKERKIVKRVKSLLG